MDLPRVLQIALVGAAVAVLGLIGRFAAGQKRSGTTGGALSRPKQLWLAWTVYTWFFVCPLVALDPRTPDAFRPWLGAFAAGMWIRGIAELVMLYGTKNWRPPYGIAHDLLSLAVVGAGLFVSRGAISTTEPGGQVAWALGALVAISLVVETYYAWAFFHLVHGRTTGEDGIWFASEEDPRFIRINRITAAIDVPLYVALAAFLAAWIIVL